MSIRTIATHVTAPTQFIQVGPEAYAYRRFGVGPGFPLLFLQHFTGTLDNWDPAVTDALAAGRDVINLGVGDPDRPTPWKIGASGEAGCAGAASGAAESAMEYGFCERPIGRWPLVSHSDSRRSTHTRVPVYLRRSFANGREGSRAYEAVSGAARCARVDYL